MSTRVFSERLLLLALLSTAGAGCQRPRESPEAYAARVVVQRYNQLLPEAFRASRGDLLAEVAGPAEVSRVSSVIAGLSSQGKYMEARQLEFTPVEVRVEGPPDGGTPSATVRSRERWSYQHLFIGVPEGQRVDKLETGYRMTYTLAREAERWVVESAMVEQE